MSAIAAAAQVVVFLADYAAADAGNKLNILGAGWQVTRIDPETGATGAQALIVAIEVPPEYYDEEFALEVALYNDADELVQVPGPAGEPAPLRVGHTVKAEKPSTPGQFVPAKTLWARVQMVLNFPGGLSIPPGRSYEWRLRIDGDDDYKWSARFHVAGTPPQPTFG